MKHRSCPTSVVLPHPPTRKLRVSRPKHKVKTLNDHKNFNRFYESKILEVGERNILPMLLLLKWLTPFLILFFYIHLENRVKDQGDSKSVINNNDTIPTLLKVPYYILRVKLL